MLGKRVSFIQKLKTPVGRLVQSKTARLSTSFVIVYIGRYIATRPIFQMLLDSKLIQNVIKVRIASVFLQQTTSYQEFCGNHTKKMHHAYFLDYFRVNIL